jgi:hypothetical protein
MYSERRAYKQQVQQGLYPARHQSAGFKQRQYYTDYAALIDTIRLHQPDTVIYLQSILPVSREKDAGSTVFTKDRVLLFQ